MESFQFIIDEKSLFYGIKNDFSQGQSATVNTPINQASNPESWHNDILELTKYNIASKLLPEMLLRKCLKNTTSNAKSRINYFFEFKNLLLDGKKLQCNSSFAMYIKEEIDEFITNREGKKVLNTHLGRLKLHYPISFNFKSDGFNVDNSDVLNAILEQNGGFAFVVRGFVYSIKDNSLNFITTMVGPKNMLLSNVFKRGKGTGKKLLLEEIDVNDFELINDTYATIKQIPNANIATLFEQANKTKVENGKIGEQIVLDILNNNANVREVYHTSKDFPISPYDIEYYENGIKKYVEVKSTQGDKKIFHMSIGEIKFMNKYKDDYILYLITKVKDKFPILTIFNCDKILQLKHEYPTTKFFA